ncbi:hypothetical protein [Streptomyces canarius]
MWLRTHWTYCSMLTLSGSMPTSSHVMSRMPHAVRSYPVRSLSNT